MQFRGLLFLPRAILIPIIPVQILAVVEIFFPVIPINGFYVGIVLLLLFQRESIHHLMELLTLVAKEIRRSLLVPRRIDRGTVGYLHLRLVQRRVQL